ncbi:hypothetical protein J3Q64DRAFT_1767961 [Phycomyces blakesleeanus]|uniref:Uncharacterized protein n=1 Tax=Phycomyces blakesleeanus TaxID=4837 RepID=A0ABR3AN14_PHYBL
MGPLWSILHRLYSLRKNYLFYFLLHLYYITHLPSLYYFFSNLVWSVYVFLLLLTWPRYSFKSNFVIKEFPLPNI